MSVVVERVKRELEKIFDSKIDMSDITLGTDKQKKEHMLSRALAAYSLIMEGNLSPEDAALCITDGCGDFGLDAIYIDAVMKRFLIVQSKIRNDGSSSLDIGDMSAFCKGISRLINSDYANANSKILSKQAEIDDAIFSVGYKIEAVIIYTSDTPLSQEVESLVHDLQGKINEGGEVFSYKTILLKEIHDHMKTGAVGKVIDRKIQVENWGVLKDHEIPRGYYGLMSAQELGKMWKEHKSSLLSKNIRFFKGSTEVNEGIKKCLKERPERFVYYNNGIKIIADKITRSLSHVDSTDCGLFELKNLSIVNGAQTIGCVGDVYEENPDLLRDVKIFAHIISLENTEDGFGNAVTRLSNTQNKIEKKDFLSVGDPYHENLKKTFALDGYNYSYRTGDSKDTSPKSCTVDEAVVALGCAVDDVDISTRIKSNVGSIYDDLTGGIYKSIFNSSVGTHRVWNSIQFQKQYDSIRVEYSKQHEKLEKLVSIHGNCFVLHLFFVHYKNSTVFAHFNDQYLEFKEFFISDMRSWFCRIVDEIIKIKNFDYPESYPANLFKNATKCKTIKEKLNANGVL